MPLSAEELGKVADQYFEKHEERLALQKEVTDLEKEEASLKKKIIDELIESKITSIGGRLVKYELKKEDEPTVPEGKWEPVFEWLRQTGEFDIIQRRLNPRAIKDRLENNVEIPGIGWFPVYKLSQSKVK